jgi:hypothetical protein
MACSRRRMSLVYSAQSTLRSSSSVRLRLRRRAQRPLLTKSTRSETWPRAKSVRVLLRRYQADHIKVQSRTSIFALPAAFDIQQFTSCSLQATATSRDLATLMEVPRATALMMRTLKQRETMTPRLPSRRMSQCQSLLPLLDGKEAITPCYSPTPNCPRLEHSPHPIPQLTGRTQLPDRPIIDPPPMAPSAAAALASGSGFRLGQERKKRRLAPTGANSSFFRAFDAAFDPDVEHPSLPPRMPEPSTFPGIPIDGPRWVPGGHSAVMGVGVMGDTTERGFDWPSFATTAAATAAAVRPAPGMPSEHAYIYIYVRLIDP